MRSGAMWPGGQDRSPLLFMVNLEGEEDKPVGGALKAATSERDLNVSRGAAALISRWPGHVHSSARFALLLTVVVALACVGVVTVFMYAPELRGGAVPACGAGGAGGFRFLAEGEHSVFFVAAAGRPLTAAQEAALTAASARNGNTSVFLVTVAVRDGPPAEEGGAAGGVVRVRVRAADYLRGSPVSGVPPQLAPLAVRLLTLWRFGGLALDLDAVSLRPAAPALAGDPRDVRLDTAGHVIDVRTPCHAFIFQAMRALQRLHLEGVQNATAGTRSWSGAGAGAVLAAAREAYCSRPHCRPGAGDSWGQPCPGLSTLPETVVCPGRPRQPPPPPSCTWITAADPDPSDGPQAADPTTAAPTTGT